MPLQNRVTPLGDIAALAARGTMMGNRGGRIHDPASRRLLTRRFASRQWICCVLDFKARRRQVMGAGYTELFFLDEVTALAAGHRPCFECRRDAATAFAAAFARGNSLASIPRAGEMDRSLHGQRLDGRAKRLHPLPASLPDGAMILVGDDIIVRKANRWLRWTAQGYQSTPTPDMRQARLVTPPAIVGALNHGYAPHWHGSAA